MHGAIRRCLMTGVAVLPLLAAVPSNAQDAGFAIEVSPPVDAWTGFRIGVSVFGETVEPASGYVRGCAGHVMEERAGVRLQVTEPLETLTLTVGDEAVSSLVLGTPDGLYRCVLRGSDGMVAARLDGVAPGRYQVWVAGAEASRLDTRLIVSDRPVSALDLRGLDVASLGAPRNGTHVFEGGEERQVLAANATLFAESPMDPLSAEYCAGHSRFDAADAVLTLTGPEQVLSIFATSGRDLTLAVRTPDGRVLCNDDSNGLDPAVTVRGAGPGDYLIFVGGFSPGSGDRFDLFANRGAPAWGGTVMPIGDGTPRLGFLTLEREQAARGQLLGTGGLVAVDALSGLPTGGFCAGFSGLDAPDAVVSVGSREAVLSFYATSSSDLVIAVQSPDGQWACNDDSFGLNPAVSFDGASAGDYQVYVGAYSQGDSGRFNLYASVGQPNWSGADTSGGSGGALDPGAEPAIGRIGFGTDTRIEPRVIFDISPSQFEARGLGDGCAGFITPDQPDVVVQAGPSLPQLMVYMVSEADGVLTVVGPDGTVHCNDDFEGLNPGIMIPNPAPGDYAVFAGTYGGNGGVATLGVTIANPLWVMDREH
jgi:hypothetical protein